MAVQWAACPQVCAASGVVARRIRFPGGMGFNVELALLSADFEEGEDDEDVLLVLCTELTGFLEGFDSVEQVRKKRPAPWAAEEFSAVFSLLLRIMLHRDRELKATALRAFVALTSACDDMAAVKNTVIDRVIELSEDQRDMFRQAAASLLPATLRWARRCLARLQTGPRAQEAAEHERSVDALLEAKQRLLNSYVKLCGDKNCAVQLAAGQQLPIFVEYIAAEVEALQQCQTLQQKPLSGTMDGCMAVGDGEIGELMIAVYTATQKLTLSINVRFVGSPCDGKMLSRTALPGIAGMHFRVTPLVAVPLLLGCASAGELQDAGGRSSCCNGSEECSSVQSARNQLLPNAV